MRRQLTRIKAIQIALVEMGAIEKVLPLLARSNDDIAKETLAFLSILLFNANKDVQVRAAPRRAGLRARVTRGPQYSNWGLSQFGAERKSHKGSMVLRPFEDLPPHHGLKAQQ